MARVGIMSADTDARAYLDAHNVPTAIRDAVAHAVRTRPSDPIAAISDYLKQAASKPPVPVLPAYIQGPLDAAAARHRQRAALAAAFVAGVLVAAAAIGGRARLGAGRG